MWPGSGPVKAQCVPCGAVSDWPDEHEPDGDVAETVTYDGFGAPIVRDGGGTHG